jgi:ferric-dicitrate binding protein FerR (iron transport regulator)
MDRDLVEPTMPVSEQAAAWFFELGHGPSDRGTRQAFVRWLKHSPAHIDAFLSIAMLDFDLARLTGSGRAPGR